MDDSCAVCNLSESRHHSFHLDNRPVGCKCDISWWPIQKNREGSEFRVWSVIEEICGNYEEWPRYKCCLHCEHGRDCHTSSIDEGVKHD